MHNNLIRNTFIYTMGDIIPKIMSFIIFPLLTSHIEVTDYGIINYVNAIVYLFSIVGMLCVNTYYLVYYYRVGDIYEKRKLLGNLSIFVIGVNIVLSSFYFILGLIFPNLFSKDVTFFPYIVIGIFTNFFNILTVLPSALYRVQERPLILTLLNILRGILTTVLTALLVVKYNFTALGILYTSLIISIIFGLIFFAITIKNIILTINIRQIGTALKFSLPLLPGALAYYFITMSDRLFIARYLDLKQLGIYTTASTLAMMLNIIANGAYKAFEPYFFKIYRTKEFNEKFVIIHNIYILIILFGAMGLSIFSKEFFFIFATETYQEVYYYVPLLEIGVVFSSLNMLYSTIITAREKTKYNSIIMLIGGGINILLNILFLPLMGIVGSCLASGCSLGIIMVLSSYLAKLKISFVRPIIAIGISMITIYILVYLLNFDLNSIYLNFLVKIIIFFISILLLMYILRLHLIKLIGYFLEKKRN